MPRSLWEMYDVGVRKAFQIRTQNYRDRNLYVFLSCRWRLREERVWQDSLVDWLSFPIFSRVPETELGPPTHRQALDLLLSHSAVCWIEGKIQNVFKSRARHTHHPLIPALRRLRWFTLEVKTAWACCQKAVWFVHFLKRKEGRVNESTRETQT